MQLLACVFYVDLNIPFMIRYLGGQWIQHPGKWTELENKVRSTQENELGT